MANLGSKSSTWDVDAAIEAASGGGPHAHVISDVTNLQTSLDGKAAAAHTHTKANITDFAHTHLEADVTGLTEALAGKAASNHTHAGAPLVVKSTGDQTKTDATLINVTNCSFALTAGTYYKFQFLIPFRSTVLTVGLKAGLTFPAATVFACTGEIPIAAAGAGAVLQGYITASAGFVLGTSVAAINTDYLAILDGFILPSANGTLQLQFAAETTGATVTCRNGACGMLYTL